LPGPEYGPPIGYGIGVINLPSAPNLSGPSGGSSAAGLPSAGKYLFLHKALSTVAAGVGDQKILCIGDSVTQGIFALCGQAWVPAFAKYITQFGINSAEGLAIAASSAASPSADARWTVGANWGFSTPAQCAGWGGFQGCAYIGTPAGGNLVFTPSGAGTTINCNSFDVYYETQNVASGFTATGSGGGAQVVNSNTGTIGVSKVTCPCAGASTLNTLTVNTITGFEAVILGVEPVLTTTPTLRVGNAGSIGTTAGSWANGTSGNGGATALQCIAAYAPNVTIIGLGLNDINVLNTPVATYEANLLTVINVCKLTGDVVLWNGPPANPAVNPFASASAQTAFWNTNASFCANNDLGFLDAYTAWGTASEFTKLNTDGYYADGAIHPSQNVGHADLGRILAQGLLLL
jgi:lysophospholipase L1-like esterase